MRTETKLKKVTLKEVAAAAELAVPTVSQILNGRRNFCSAEQVARVRGIASDLGYMPNIGYKIMTGQKTRTVGLIFSQVRTYHDEHVLMLAMNLITRLEKTGESVYAAIMGDDAGENLRSIRELVNRGCAAFLFLGSPIGTPEIFAELEQRGINYVSDNNTLSKRDIFPDIPYVYNEYIRHLLERDIRDFICIMTGSFFDSNCRGAIEERYRAGILGEPDRYLHDIDPIEGVDFDCSELFFEQGYQATKEALAKTPGIRGWLYPLDYLALGGVRALAEAGLTVGRDVHVYGRNNTKAARFAMAPVNTTDLCIDEYTDWMVEHLHDKTPVIKKLKPQIIFKS